VFSIIRSVRGSTVGNIIIAIIEADVIVIIKLDKYGAHYHHTIFKLFKAVKICDMKIVIFLDITACNLMDRYSNDILQ
jgi:uncharacterized protein YrrD